MIRLEKFEKNDFNRLINWIDSEESMVLFSGPIFDYPITHVQLDEYINTDNRLTFRVVDINSSKIIGHAELNNIDLINKNARISRVLVGDKQDRNKGYGKAIINELVNMGFKELKLHRLDLAVYDFNKQAIKCYVDCGFEIEGLFKDNKKVGNKYWSTYNMSIINQEN